MVARIRTVAFEGVDVRPVDAQVQVSGGMPAFTDIEPTSMWDTGCHGRYIFQGLAGLASLFLAAALVHPAQAASFDCARPTTTVEALICNDETLSHLDDALAAAYTSALEESDGANSALLKANQRSWLKTLRSTCPVDATGAVQCLATVYRQRILDLRRKLIFADPYVFAVIDRSWQEAGGEYCSGKTLDRSLSYPRLLAAASPGEITWNDGMAVRAEFELGEWLAGDTGCSAEFSLDYAPAAAMPSFIVTKETATWMGLSHYWDSVGFDNRFVDKGTNLTEGEIFRTGSGWEEALAKRVKDFVDDTDPELMTAPEYALNLATNRSFWIVGRDNLTIVVDLKGLFGPANDRPELIIPWRALKTYLRPDLPITLNPD